MKKRFFKKVGSIIIAFFSLLFSDHCFSQSGQLKFVEVNYVKFNIETFDDVRCQEFEKAFKTDQYLKKLIEDSLQLAHISDAFKAIKYKNDTTSINVRAKLYLHYSYKIDPTIICLNKFFDIMINGKLIKKNKQLSRVLSDLLYQR